MLLCSCFQTNIIVGTPGRLLDMIKSGKLNLSETRFFVMDEADRLIEDAGGVKVLASVLSSLPPFVRYHTSLSPVIS